MEEKRTQVVEALIDEVHNLIAVGSLRFVDCGLCTLSASNVWRFLDVMVWARRRRGMRRGREELIMCAMVGSTGGERRAMNLRQVSCAAWRWEVIATDSYPELLQYHGRKLAILEYSHEDVHGMVISYALEGTDPFQVSLHKLQNGAHVRFVQMTHGGREKAAATMDGP